MKTLYVSDLDGTLLRSDETTSEYTNSVVNRLTEKGMIFSYATARSLVTSKKVTKGLNARIPLIVYNGAFVMDNVTGEIILSNYFDRKAGNVFCDLMQGGVYPIVYAFVDGVERFSYLASEFTRGTRDFVASRKGDIRARCVPDARELTRGDCFYITCIDEPEKLEAFYEKYRQEYHCVYQRDIYSGEQWLEIMPRAASKSNAVLRLKERMGCERVVVFGDGKNDIDMFEIADECYAVENAVPELKERATAVIGGHDEDGVAKWLEANVRFD